MSKFLGWRAQTSIAENYLNAVESMLSTEENFNNFRSGSGGYAPILEHLTQNEGQIYANYILENYPELLSYLDKFRENDSVGNPILFEYKNLGRFNPTTLRYIKFLGDIRKTFGDLDDIHLVEIGGGYGGLVKMLSNFYDFKTVKLFDLRKPLLLQKKYLNGFNIDVELYTHEDMFNINENTLVISNYAWCECDRNTRDLYVDKIINKSKYVYMVVYDVDMDGELMVMDGEKTLEKETLNECRIFTLKK